MDRSQKEQELTQTCQDGAPRCSFAPGELEDLAQVCRSTLELHDPVRLARELSPGGKLHRLLFRDGQMGDQGEDSSREKAVTIGIPDDNDGQIQNVRQLTEIRREIGKFLVVLRGLATFSRECLATLVPEHSGGACYRKPGEVRTGEGNAGESLLDVSV